MFQNCCRWWDWRQNTAHTRDSFPEGTRWAVYEGIQSDIFDHLLAILPIFDLRVFQQCSDTSGMVIPSPALLSQSALKAVEQSESSR